jgi:hypothetical protein
MLLIELDQRTAKFSGAEAYPNALRHIYEQLQDYRQLVRNGAAGREALRDRQAPFRRFCMWVEIFYCMYV